jgi:hypothetical protein
MDSADHRIVDRRTLLEGLAAGVAYILAVDEVQDVFMIDLVSAFK